MLTYYRYVKKQRTIALKLLFNAGLLLLMYAALVHYLPGYGQKEAVNQLIAVANIAIWPIEAILIGLAIYFWIENKAFELSVSPSEFYYHDPTFTDVTYRIPIKDIIALEQYTNVQQSGTTNRLVLKTGKHKQLMYGNFSIDRRAFFAALKKAKPDIQLPENPYQYEVKQPNWAKRFLNKDK